MHNPTSQAGQSNRSHTELPEPNPATMARHRREVFRQITLPFAAGTVVFLVIAASAWISTASDASLWADIALIFLITLLGMATLFFLTLAAMIAYGMIAANRNLPPYTRLVQDKVNLASHYLRYYSDRVASPIITIQSRLAWLKAIVKQLKP